MNILPVLFSTILAIHVYRRNRVDLAFFISMMFVVSSSFALVLLNTPNGDFLEDYQTFRISLVPTVLFCLCNYICVYPVFKYNTNKARIVQVELNAKFYKYLNFILLAYTFAFILLIVLFSDQYIQRLVISNMNEIRNSYYAKDDSLMSSFSLYKKLLGYYALALSSGGYFLIVIFYYLLSFGKNSKLYTYLFLIYSMLPILGGILNMDRSNSFYWILTVCMGYFIFKPYMSPSNSKFLRRVLVIFGGVILLYFASVTIARFGDTDWGAQNALFDYIGQPYPNLCNEWNCVNIQGFDFSTLFPLLNILPGYVADIKEYNPLDISTNGFPTFIGHIVRSLGHFWGVVCSIFLFFFINNNVKKMNRTMKFGDFMLLFVLFMLPETGLISYFFNHEWRFVLAFAFIYLSKKIALQK